MGHSFEIIWLLVKIKGKEGYGENDIDKMECSKSKVFEGSERNI